MFIHTGFIYFVIAVTDYLIVTTSEVYGSKSKRLTYKAGKRLICM